jgi:adenine-specific DNA-methyltransferase
VHQRGKLLLPPSDGRTVSRLNDLLRQLKEKVPQLAQDLEKEVEALANRRAFGLNFERHVPETVELPGRKVRKGDKVRILPPRGQVPTKADDRLWRVAGVDRQSALASLSALAGDETAEAALADLVVVAEFRDPIYPGIVSTGKVERGGGKPFHTVINAENFHALETLLFTHRGKVDAIYIDPPYNTGARDWKYNNDYVEGDDLYRHSKWLAFMERRLLLIKELLNPDNSVLIVTIDEKEVHRLGLLLEQVFTGPRIQMVSTLINPAAVARKGYFGRSDEYIFFVMVGDAGAAPLLLGEGWITTAGRTHRGDVRWDLLRRSGSSPTREGHPDTFYPIFLTDDGRRFHSIGEPIGVGNSRSNTVPPEGTFAVWPIRQNGTEGRWALQPSTARAVLEAGCLRIGEPNGEQTPIYYLAQGERAKIDQGVYKVLSHRTDGSVVTERLEVVERRTVPGNQWRITSHDATQYGTRLLAKLLPNSKFPFPKSLYAVEDSLRFFVGGKPDALVMDFFAGSGTTAHAIMRLNKQDGGQRLSVMVTNNEVAADEQKELRLKHLRPGDAEWEKLGICESITRPRITAAVTGRTSEGQPVEGNYKFTDEFPMAEGFEENVEFFTLTYEAPLRVASNREFAKIAPLLWMRAGSHGRRIDACRTDGT